MYGGLLPGKKRIGAEGRAWYWKDYVRIALSSCWRREWRKTLLITLGGKPVEQIRKNAATLGFEPDNIAARLPTSEFLPKSRHTISLAS